MKRIIAVATLATLAANIVLAQGTVQFNNNLGASVLRAPVYMPDPLNNQNRISGNPSTVSFPVGTTDYHGAARVSGTGYYAQLWYGADTITDPLSASLSSLDTLTTFNTAGAAGFFIQPGNNLVIPGGAPGSTAYMFQVRVWDNAGGTITSWANATTRGYSDLFRCDPLGGGEPPNTVIPSRLVGMRGFNLTVVPEPSTIALGVLGLGALVLFRRRKN